MDIFKSTLCILVLHTVSFRGEIPSVIISDVSFHSFCFFQSHFEFLRSTAPMWCVSTSEVKRSMLRNVFFNIVRTFFSVCKAERNMFCNRQWVMFVFILEYWWKKSLTVKFGFQQWTKIQLRFCTWCHSYCDVTILDGKETGNWKS